MKVFVYSWGGEPIKMISRGAEIPDADVKRLKEWSRLISDPAYVKDMWLPLANDGRVWLEGPSSDFQRRLLLRPFSSVDGQRKIWHFWGFSFLLGSPITWARVFRQLVAFDRAQLEGCEGEIELSGAYDDNEVPVERRVTGRVFGGSYNDALLKLCAGIAASSHEQLCNLSIACHPPRSLAGFSTLVLTDDFPLKGVGILPPKFGGDELIKIGKGPRIQWKWNGPPRKYVLLMTVFVIGFILGRATDSNDRQVKKLSRRIEKLIDENDSLYRQIRQIEEQPSHFEEEN